ncbi:MAG: hypothetical protein R2732_05235 [Microbacteriaceae bacterium]|jgi:hypothetical protein|nr:hypothetical protein [Microbacteriaceae bacterium]HPZ34712.1 hypothetical protein [Microbacteriaceae bacterium]HQC93177.1 hypothetical protein [Microbacteriaceae bacterium]
MAGFWGARRAQREQLAAQDASLALRAQQALVETDERVRLAGDELLFATAELGDDPTAALREALGAVRHHLAEAFELHQLNHDEIPDTPEELRTRNARIVQLCEWALGLLEHHMTALEVPIANARRAPEVLAQLRAEAAGLRARIPGAQETIVRLGARYSTEALQQIAHNADEAAQLLDFAEHSGEIAKRRREEGQRSAANYALEAATESVRRAGTLLRAVEDYEIEALRAESALAAVVVDSRDDLIRAQGAPQAPAVAVAMQQLQGALTALPAGGTKSDPFAQLSSLREANAALDAAITAAHQRAARPIPPIAYVRHAIDDAESQLGVARSVIAGHRGWIGADARTRLAEAERTIAAVEPLIGDEDTRERALELARRAGALAAEALRLAQHDIDSSRPQDQQGGWGNGPRGNAGNNGGSGMGAVLGGVLLGSLLGGMFD